MGDQQGDSPIVRNMLVAEARASVLVPAPPARKLLLAQPAHPPGANGDSVAYDGRRRTEERDP